MLFRKIAKSTIGIVMIESHIPRSSLISKPINSHHIHSAAQTMVIMIGVIRMKSIIF